MLEQINRPLRMKALIIDKELRGDSAFARASRTLVTELRARDVDVMEA